MMEGKTQREPAANPTQRDGGAAPTQRETTAEARPDARSVVFPTALSERYDPEESFSVAGGEADCYRLRDKKDGQTYFGKVYRQGNSPNASVLELLNQAAADKVVRLIDSAPATPTSRAWEVTEFMSHGSLAELIAREGQILPPHRVREILIEILDALQHVHGLNVEHKDLKPANILVRSLEPLDLVLTDFGISSTMGESVRHTNRHRTVEYAPPEAASGTVYRNKWDCWSLGIILVEMLTGTHPLSRMVASGAGGVHVQRIESMLAVGDVDDLVDGVEGQDWARLCRGLLRRKPEFRWSADWVALWLANPDDPSLVVPDEKPVSTVQPFKVQGNECRSPEAVAAILRPDEELLARIWRERGAALIEWIEDELGLPALARTLITIRQADEGLNCQLMRLLCALDASQPPQIDQRTITVASLVALADTLSSSDQAGCAWLVSLYTEDILGKAIPLASEGGALREVSAAWREAVTAYEVTSASVNSASQGTVTPAPLAGQSLAMLLAAAMPGSAAIGRLRHRAAEVSTGAAMRSLWFQALGDARTASPATALVTIETASAADAQVRASDEARDERNNELWTAMSVGAGVGGTVGLLWWWLTHAWCSSGDNTCIRAGWYTQQIGVFDILFAAAALATTLAVLVSVHQQTGSGRV